MFKLYKGNKLTLSTSMKGNNVPRVVVPSFMSKIFKQSIDFKGCKLWNNLPNT